MADSPKLIEDKYTRILNAWKSLAPNKSFGGMTLAEFETQVGKSDATRQRLQQLDDETRQEQKNRETEDTAMLKNCDLIVKSVIADADFGDDSALYESMGYIRKSNRKSGLTRRKAADEKK